MEPPVQEHERQRYGAPTASIHHPNSSPTSRSDSSLLSSSSGSDASSSERGIGEGEQQVQQGQEQRNVQSGNGIGGHDRDDVAHAPPATSLDPARGSNGAAAESGSSSSEDSHARKTQPIHQIAAGPGSGTSARRIIPTQVHPAGGYRMVPIPFQHCEMPDVIALVAGMLDRLLAYNDSLPPSSRPLTRFHSKAAPSISAHAYLTRITTFTNVDPCILLILLYYIDKLSPDYLTINSLTVHRFLIAAICCGSKALSDSFATNSRYAKVGGVELVEMNALEREFLIAIDWRLATSGALLDQYWRSLVEAHPGYRLAPPLSAQHGSVAPSLQQPTPHSPATSGIPADPHRPHKKAKAAVDEVMQTAHRASPAPP